MVQEEVEGGKNLEKEEVITNADSEPIDSVWFTLTSSLR